MCRGFQFIEVDCEQPAAAHESDRGAANPRGTRPPSPALVPPFSSPLSPSLPSSAPSSLLHCFDCTSIQSPVLSLSPLSSFFSLNLSSSLFSHCFLPLLSRCAFSRRMDMLSFFLLSHLLQSLLISPPLLLFHVTAFILQLLFMPLGRVCVGSRG